MKIGGKFWKDDNYWLVEIPLLNLITQAKSKKEIPVMVKDAIELLVNKQAFSVDVTLSDTHVFVEASDLKKLIALILKRQRLKQDLTLEEVAHLLKAKSINEYAQYEQGKHLPSLDKFDQLLSVLNPSLTPYISLN